MMVVDVAENVSWKYQFKFVSFGVITLVTLSCSTKPMEKNLGDRSDREVRTWNGLVTKELHSFWGAVTSRCGFLTAPTTLDRIPQQRSDQTSL